MSKLVDKIGQFTTIPNSLIRLWPVIGGDAVLMFLYLRWRSDEHDHCWPSLNTMEADTDLSRKRIVRALDTLEDHGLLLKERRFSGSTIYTLLMPGAPAASSEVAAPAAQAVEAPTAKKNGAGHSKKPVDNPQNLSLISATGALMEAPEQSQAAPISATGALPLVPQVHCISATGALPLVPQVHANKTQLTRLIEPDPINKTSSSLPPSQKGQEEEVYSKGLRDRLIEAHIFPATFKTFSRSLSEQDLRALLDWVEETTEEPEKVPKFFVSRAKDGVKAPQEFYVPACPRCGWHGEHADDCPRRYSDGSS